jgi:hypothetical protein
MVVIGAEKSKHVPITSKDADFVILAMLRFDLEELRSVVWYALMSYSKPREERRLAGLKTL